MLIRCDKNRFDEVTVSCTDKVLMVEGSIEGVDKSVLSHYIDFLRVLNFGFKFWLSLASLTGILIWAFLGGDYSAILIGAVGLKTPS